MTAPPTDYPWSSYRCNALGAFEARIKAHPSHLQLGAADANRQSAYRDLVANGLSREEADALRLHTQQQRVWGDDRFRAQIEALTQRTVTVRPRGQPSTARK